MRARNNGSRLYLFSPITNGFKWVPVGVEVDIVFEKTFGGPWQPRLYTPQGAYRSTRMLLA